MKFQCYDLKAFQVMFQSHSHPADIYFFKVNNENTRAMCEICLKITIKTLD